jgi:uncharacterized protein (TIGR00251 family)
MNLNIRVKFGSKVNVLEGDPMQVTLTQPPEKGRANKQLIEVLAKYFKIQKNQVKLISGARSRNKVVEILNNR